MSHRGLVIGLLTAAAIALGAPSAVAAAPFVAKLKAPSTSPKVNKNWTITVSARTRGGNALKATAFYQFLFNNQVVSTQYPSPGKKAGSSSKPYVFTGSYKDPLRFPARAVGIPLTLRVVVRVAGKGAVKLDESVRVRT
jgi:hypothetical protein